METTQSRSRIYTAWAIFLVTLIAGLAYVKWLPYYAKSLTVLAHHTVGTSIVTGSGATPPAFGWQAAWQFALAYYNAIWEAFLLALIVGAAVQVLVPRRWIADALGRAGSRSIALGTVLSLGGMMCTCCTAPIVVGLRNQRASSGASIAILLANPVLNPAVLIFILAVLGWQFAVLRLAVGALLVLGTALIVQRYGSAREMDEVVERSALDTSDPTTGGALLLAWLRALWNEARTMVPGYVVIVLLLGAARAWLFTPHLTLAGGSILTAVILAIVGTLFVIPTGGEVPIVQTLMGAGLGAGSAAVLLIALPAISLPSLYMVRSAFSRRALAMTAAGVAAAALVAGAVATFAHLT